jgi:hypothetical protein
MAARSVLPPDERGPGRIPRPGPVAAKEALSQSELLPAMDGRPAKQSRKRLIPRS